MEQCSFDGRSGGTIQPMTLKSRGKDRATRAIGTASIDARTLKAGWPLPFERVEGERA
jgi:hypothetical protein